MNTGALDATALPGGLNLYTTLESGQTYVWRREDGRMYAEDDWKTAGRDPGPWYYTVVPTRDGRVAHRDPDAQHVVRVRRAGDDLEWESSTDAEPLIRELLRLDDDLHAIEAAAPDDQLFRDAFDYGRGMRIVADPPFACTISFICSAQMRVARIHDMVTALADAYGEEIQFDGDTYHAFPTPDRLAAASEAALRDLALGYRAPYVQQTAAMVADGDAHPDDARDRDYEAARDHCTTFVGVGDKVADCILLFSLGHLEAVPLDTWIRTCIADYYPDCDRGNYADTSRAIRERFGGAHAGYVQTYVFHYLRTQDVEAPA
jgi:N-glycosylase/DNA lyase